MINKIISALGLNEDEIKTYLSVMEMGSTTAGGLAKKLGMPRPSVYGFLKRLQDKGMVTQSLKAGVKMFAAEPSEKINLLFQQKIADMQAKQRMYKSLLPELQKHHPAKFLNPKFQLFEGEEGVKPE